MLRTFPHRFIDTVGDVVVANAGSLSLPKEGTAHSYLTIQNNIITLKDVEGNILDSKKIK